MEKWLPVIDPEACTGCVACVDACNPGCLEMRDGIAALAHADACAGNEHCVESCPTNAIAMQWVAAHGDQAVGRWRGAPIAPAPPPSHPTQ
jgi:NAD-dependent dihydropyrimidine dehydrogenase PreA subunit